MTAPRDNKKDSEYLDHNFSCAQPIGCSIASHFEPELPPFSDDEAYRILGNAVPAKIADYERIKLAVEHCTEKHARCRPPTERSDLELTMIDCVNRCLIPFSLNRPYICLSYVWGAPSTEDSDATLPDALPKTIEDAMDVAAQLGIPYLWVDRYCIDQENLPVKLKTIQQMDKIYGCAEITIIATHGNGPHEGLPGVRGTARARQCRLDLGENVYVDAGLILPTVIWSLPEEIKTSTWFTRGWTFQEMLLSRRCLAFTSLGMYYQCRTQYFAEAVRNVGDVVMSEESKRVPQVFPCLGDDGRIKDLVQRLSEYSTRTLSFNRDLINAFLGIFNAFDAAKIDNIRVTHFYGIPVLYRTAHDIELATITFLGHLQWNIGFDQLSQEWESDTFPYWSWASEKGVRPAEDNAALSLGRLDPEKPAFGANCAGMEVRLWHKQRGSVPLSAILSPVDDHLDYLPRVDVSTWATTVSRMKGDEYPIDPDLDGMLARQTGDVHVICLHLEKQWNMPSRIAITGLYCIETAAHEYRRLRNFYIMIEMTRFNVAVDDEEAMEAMRDTLVARGVSSLEDIEGDGWARRTFTLV
ncbi:hypothetical protein ACN47E_006057 [Coniothyrium glycines]